MYRKLYPRIGLLAGLLAIVLMTTISTSADARSGATSGSAKVSQGGSLSNAVAADPGKFRSRIQFASSRGTFNGLFVPTTFVEQDGKVLVKGAVAGKVHRFGHAARWISQSTSMVVKNASVDSTSSSPVGVASLVSCSVLHLVLGPLHLNLLGLVIDLNQVILTITAIPSSEPGGGLLGDILCALSGGPTPTGGTLSGLLNQLIGFLNQILAGIGG